MPSVQRFKIRVVTPALARRPTATSLLDIADNTTLGRLRELVAQHLGISGNSPQAAQQQSSHECNCSFARRIHERGRWAPQNCWCAGGVGAEATRRCALCTKLLRDHSCEYQGSLKCTGKVFVRTDTSCGHSLHSTCLKNGKTWECPLRCALCKFVL